MNSLLAGFQASLLWLGAVALLSFAGLAIAANVVRMMRKARRRAKRAAAGLAAVAAVAVMYGGGKISVNGPYITDAGSYLTNDVAHVAIAKRTPIVPDDTEILVYARELASTNAADWSRLDPHLTLAEHPYDYELPNATNYNVVVAADFVPAPTVHTNGVWQIKGFVIPGTGKAAFPNTRTIKKETP